MSDNPLTPARFDHVGEHGELVFEADGTRFAVEVNDALERAVLEAKQIAEEHAEQETRPTPTLPISQIQALIRAGADPTRVAERYGLKEALVRRFSAAVETEKQYAIEQFLRVPAPKESRVHTVAELIERTLAASRIGMESVSWRATRRGLEPWKITATFTSAGRKARAEWTWNMHDNAVVCLNATAQKLIGETMATGAAAGQTAGALDDGIDIAGVIPGDSVRSARIERAVSSWGTPEPSMPPARPETPRTVPVRPAEPIADMNVSANMGAAAPAVSSAFAAGAGNTTSSADASSAAANASGSSNLSPATSAVSSAMADSPAPSGKGNMSTAAADSSASPLLATASDANGQNVTKADDSSQNDKPATKAKRRSRRSAVPSWDEILFGD